MGEKTKESGKRGGSLYKNGDKNIFNFESFIAVIIQIFNIAEIAV